MILLGKMAQEISIIKKLDHPSFTASLRSDGIVYFEMNDIEDYTIEIVDAQTKALFEFGNGKKLPIMVAFTSYNSPNDKTMKYASEEENIQYTKAAAVIVDSLALRLGTNFYLNFFTPKVPTKLFGSKDDAIKWLKE
jgi:hypothetical protein